MKALVIAQSQDAAYALSAGARTKADSVVRVSFGQDGLIGIADKTIVVDVPETNIVDDAYATINSIFDTEKPELVFFEPSRSLKSLAARLAAHANTSTITNLLEFDDAGYKNLYFGGVAERIYKPNGDVAILTIPSGVFANLEASGTDATETVAFISPAKAVRKISSDALAASDTGLLKAAKVVSVGRGFAELSELDLAKNLATKIGAEMACTRPLTEGVDWMPKSTYLGVSGVTVTPEFYIGIGISGQMQHMVGCNRAGVVVAINKDKNAPIFKQVDYGIIGDLNVVLPALIEAL
ncbi:electron transfer flavoprotein subunit alpha [Actinomycetota bacterium]|nr:electron transfer flavoprotein subunit alpha [Actinomycetota bacterium]